VTPSSSLTAARISIQTSSTAYRKFQPIGSCGLVFLAKVDAVLTVSVRIVYITQIEREKKRTLYAWLAEIRAVIF
jgi:hypothetical protein